MLKFHEEGVLDAVKSIDDGEASQRQPGCLAFGRKCPVQHCKKKFNFFQKGRHLHGISKEIEGLKERIKELSRQRQTYGLQNIGSNNHGEINNARIINLREQRRTTPLTPKRDVVGLVDEADELLGKLVDTKDPSRLIISVYGRGGLGKTTLARKLYNDQRVQKRFQHHAWVYVSQDYNTRNILQTIAKSFKTCNDEEKLRKMSEDDLEELLYKSLKEEGHSYLLVMDDVWKQEAWRVLRTALPDNQNGSRVIITSREREVAIRSDKNTHCHQLRTLNSAESLQRRQVYGNRSQALMDCEKEMLEKCKGLPLAIVVLAGLLFEEKNSQQTSEAWQRLKEKDSIDGLLSLSFNDLSRHLKLCFLYLGLFPEDYSIDAEQVIRLWMAEGLIKQDDRLILEDVARWYLDELAYRSLIQVEETSFGKIEKFCLHDLLRDLAIQKGKDIKFLHVDSSNTNPASSPTLCRRQAVYNEVERYLSLQNHNTRLRSLLIFNNQSESVTELLGHLAKYSKLLKVLHIDQGSSSEFEAVIPKESETLIHLRYLMLCGFRSMEMQSSIGSFKNLQTLHLQQRRNIDPGLTSSFKVPSQIRELKELRHLIGFFKEEVQIDNLTNLQTIYGISLGSWMKINPEKWLSLRELTIVEDKDEPEDIEFTFDSIGKIKSLRALQVRRRYDQLSSFGSLRPLSNCLDLTNLRLDGAIELPKGMDSYLPRLERLALIIVNENGAVRDDILLKCENLPNLVSLRVLAGEYKGPRRIKCKSSGFPQLQTLFLYYHGVVEEWVVEDGALPKLRNLKTQRVHQSIIPERFRSIWTPFQSS